MARQTFTASQQLTSAQMSTLQASVWSDDVNAQTASYTLVIGDAGKQVTFNSATTVTATIPLSSSVNYAIGVRIMLINLNDGVVAIAGAGGVTVNNNTEDLSVNKYGTATLYKVAADQWVVFKGMDTDDDQVIIAKQVFS
jgi:hypothetical protein